MRARTYFIAAVILMLALAVPQAQASPLKHLRAAQTGELTRRPVYGVYVTDNGNLADFESFLRQTFPNQTVCENGFRFTPGYRDGRCPSLATTFSIDAAIPYRYIFTNSGASSFKLMSKDQSNPDRWLGGNSWALAYVKGRMVACGKDHRFAVALAESEGASYPVNPPAPVCEAVPYKARNQRGIDYSPWAHRSFELTPQGILQWNLARLLRATRFTPDFALSDPRTEWNFAGGPFAHCTNGCDDYSIATLFAKLPDKSAYRVGGFYDPGEQIGDSLNDLPVLLNGRVVVCGKAPRRYLFGPNLGRYRLGKKTYSAFPWFYAVCAPPIIRHVHSADIIVTRSGRGSIHFKVWRSVSVFGWKYSCSTAVTDKPTFTVRLRQNGGQGLPSAETWTSPGPRGQRQGEPSWFAVPSNFTITTRRSCHWTFWALGLSHGREW